MAQSLVRVFVHLVFSTKRRAALIPDHTRDHLHAYMAGTLDNLGCTPVRVGGTSDHAHLLFLMGKSITFEDLLRQLKSSSTKWFKAEYPVECAKFRWQAGYAAFSISDSHVEATRDYVANQMEHHRTVSFRDELETLLRKNNVDYDPKFVFDDDWHDGGDGDSARD